MASDKTHEYLPVLATDVVPPSSASSPSSHANMPARLHTRHSSQYLPSDSAAKVVPEELERKLRQEAESKFPGDKERQDAYVYGTLRDTGWKPRKHRFGGKSK